MSIEPEIACHGGDADAVAAITIYTPVIERLRSELAALEERLEPIERDLRDDTGKNLFGERIAVDAAIARQNLAAERDNLDRIVQSILTKDAKRIDAMLEIARCNLLARLESLEFIEFEAGRWKAGERS